MRFPSFLTALLAVYAFAANAQLNPVKPSPAPPATSTTAATATRAAAPSTTATAVTSITATTPSTTRTTSTKPALNPNIVYRWVDANGRVQYSQNVPDDRQHTARALDGKKMNTVQAYRPPPSLNADINREGRPPPSGKPANSAAGAPEEGSCEAAWQAYNESQACKLEGRMAVRTAKGSRSAPDSSCPEAPKPQAPC